MRLSNETHKALQDMCHRQASHTVNSLDVSANSQLLQPVACQLRQALKCVATNMREWCVRQNGILFAGEAERAGFG